MTIEDFTGIFNARDGYRCSLWHMMMEEDEEEEDVRSTTSIPVPKLVDGIAL
jgi:hypothetical protein